MISLHMESIRAERDECEMCRRLVNCIIFGCHRKLEYLLSSVSRSATCAVYREINVPYALYSFDSTSIMSLSIATRLPPETIANIIRCIAWDIYRPSPEQYQIKASKKHLGTLSLTCRYWARLCRPHMFRHLTLRNRDDLNQFVWFIQAPSLVQPCLYDCSPHLTLELSGTWPAPWLHRTHAAFLGGDVTTDTVAKYFEILLALQSTSVEGSQDEAVKYAPRSLSTGLPRTLPGSMFPFNFIGLRDMRFRSIADVLRLIDSLPDLLLIRCTRVTFDDTSLFLPPAPARRRLKTIKLFRVSAAGGSSPDVDVRTVFALIGRGTRLSQQSLRPQLMGLNAWDAVQAIVSALVVEQSYERIHLKPDGNGQCYTLNTLV